MLVKPSGDRIEGIFENGYVEGEGTIIFANQNVYTGEMKNSKPEGQGQLLMKNLDKYVGQWHNG